MGEIAGSRRIVELGFLIIRIVAVLIPPSSSPITRSHHRTSTSWRMHIRGLAALIVAHSG